MPVLKHVPGGLRVATADQLLQPTDNLILDNASLSAEGTARKSDGYESLPRTLAGGGELDAYSIAYRGDELVAWGRDDILYSFDEAAAVWRARGAWTVTDLRISPLAVQRGAQSNVIADAIGDAAAVTWQETPLSEFPSVIVSYVSVQDLATGATLLESTELDPGSLGDPRQARAVAIDDWWLVLWRTDNSIRYRVLDRATLSLSSPATLVVTSIGPAAAVRWQGSLAWVVAAVPTGGSRTIRSWTIESDGTQTALGEWTSQIDRSIQVWDGGRPGPTVAAVTSSDAVEVAELDAAGALVSAITAGTVSVSGEISAASNLVAAETRDPGRAFLDELAVRRISYGPLTATLVDTVDHARIAAQPFVAWGDRNWLPIYVPAESSDSAAYVLREIGGAEELAAAWLGEGRAQVATREIYGRVQVSGDRVRFSVPFRDEGTSDDSSGAMITIDRPQTALATAPAVGSIALPSGGVLAAFDGRDAPYEVPWICLPEVEISASAGVIPAGAYSYAVYWEWEDSQGNVNQSAPTIVSVTFPSPGSANITIFGAPPTRRSGVRIGVARSVNPGDASVLHAVTDYTFAEEPVPGGAINLNDNISNTAAAALPIYTQAGTVAQENPNSFVASAGPVRAAVGRVFTGDPEIGDLVHFTKPFASGQALAITPSDVIGSNLPGRVTAIAEQDSTFYAFTPTSISYWTGDGPDAFGIVTSPYTSPVRLPVTSGVASQVHVAATPAGVVYVSDRGPRVIGRDRAGIAPYGQVSELFEYQGQLPGQIIYSPEDECTFVLSAAQNHPLGPVAQSPRTLRYDHGSGRWSTEQVWDSESIARSESGRLTHLRTDGAVCRVTPGVYERSGLRYSLVVGTPWLKLDLERQMTVLRCGILGRWLSPHLLRVGIAYDYDDFLSDVYEIDPERGDVRALVPWTGEPGETWSGGQEVTDPLNELDNGSWGGYSTQSAGYSQITRYQFRLTGPFRTCHAIRLITWDVTNAITGSGPAYALTAVQVEVEPGTDAMRQIDERLTY